MRISPARQFTSSRTIQATSLERSPSLTSNSNIA